MITKNETDEIFSAHPELLPARSHELDKKIKDQTKSFCDLIADVKENGDQALYFSLLSAIERLEDLAAKG